MKKLKAVLFALAVAAPFAIGATPAEAHTDACVGYWGVHTEPGFGRSGPEATYSFGLSSNAVCPGGPELNVWSGRVTGFCGVASGDGYTTMGHYFTFTWTGGMLYFSGQVTGALHIVMLDTNCFGEDRAVSAAAGTLYLSH